MNKKGHIYLGGLFMGHMGSAAMTVIAFKLAFMSIALAATWHIPAWEQAKKDHTESIYQAQQMWPQQVFNPIPTTGITYKNGNGGNFEGGMSN